MKKLILLTITFSLIISCHKKAAEVEISNSEVFYAILIDTVF